MAERKYRNEPLDSKSALLTYKATKDLFPGSPTAQGVYIAGACNKNGIPISEFTTLLFDGNFSHERNKRLREETEVIVDKINQFENIPHEAVTKILNGYYTFIGLMGQHLTPENHLERERLYGDFAQDIAAQYHNP